MAKFLSLFCKSIAWLLMSLPRRVQFFLGDMLGLLWFDVLRLRRSIVISNISKVFPHLSEKEKVKLGRRSLLNMGRGLIEYAYLPFLSQKKMDQLVKIHNAEKMHQALAKNNGVCMLTLHLGNGDLALGALSLSGFPVTLISKEFKVQWLNDLWFGMRRSLGAEFIAPRNSSYAILKALKRNRIVIFVQDQFMGPPIGAKTTFFGHETGTALGLAVMASRAHAPVVPCYTYRDAEGRHHVIFEDEVRFEMQEGQDKDVAHMTQVYNHILEGILLRHPDQWMWVHRRWKTFKED